MGTDNLKISIDIDFDNYEANMRNLNNALEQLSKATNLKLDFNIDGNTTQQLNQINEVLQKVNTNAKNLNGNKIGLNMDATLNQIKELKNYTGNLDQIKEKLSSLGDVKIKTGNVDETGIKEFTASVDDLHGRLVNLKYAVQEMGKNVESNYKFNGINNIIDNTDKLQSKINEFKNKWSQAINEINKDTVSPGAIQNLQKALNSLSVNSNKLDFNNVKKQINDLSKEANAQQQNLEKVSSFIDKYNVKLNTLYRNNDRANGGISNAQILDLKNRVNALSGSSDVGQLKILGEEYNKLVEKQKDYAQETKNENADLKKQESSLKFIASQQEKLNNIKSNYNNKIDTNNNSYKELQSQYEGLVNSLNKYKGQKKDLSTEDRISINQQINDLKRLSAEKQKDYTEEIKNENADLKNQESSLKFIASQQEKLNNTKSNYGNKIDTDSNLYKDLQSQYENLVGLLNKYKEQKKDLSTEDRISINQQVNDLRRLSNEYLAINSFIQSQTRFLTNLGNKYKSVLGTGEIDKYINDLKKFDPQTNNVVGDMDKIIKKHQELSNELNERVRIQNVNPNKILGDKIGNLTTSGLNINSGLKDIQNFLRQTVNANASVSSIKNSVDNLGNKMKEVNYTIDEGQGIVGKYKATIDGATSSIYNMANGEQNLASRHATLTERIKAAAEGFLRFQLIAGGYMAVWNSIKQGISDINALNESITNISMVTGKSIGTVNQYMQQYSQLSQQLHTTTTDVATAAEEFLRAGDSQKESLEMVKASTVMSKEAGITQEESAQGLIAISNAYGILPNKIMSVVDVMTKLDNISSSSVAEMNEAVTKTASSAKEAGVPLNKLLSYITEISHITRLPASTIGTGLNSIFSRFSSIKMGKNYDPNSGEEISLNNVEKALKTIGIHIRSDKNNFKDFSTILDELGSKWGKLNDRQKDLITTQLAG